MPENIKEEPFDLYTDSFTVTITPFGANLTFSLREPHPSPNKPPQIKPLGTVRMSVEHLKTVVWMTRQQIRQVEGQLGVKAEVASPILNQLNIPPQDWEDFWRPVSNI
jgi:hypothetical protein